VYGWGGMTRGVIALPQPSAGQGFSRAWEQSEEGFLVAITFRLVTSAVVATRTPVVQVTDGSGIPILTVVTAASASASTTADYGLAVDITSAALTTATFASGPLSPFPLRAGDTIVVSVDSIDAGDQLSRGRVVVMQDTVRDEA
jgi:hypothetical protein